MLVVATIVPSRTSLHQKPDTSPRGNPRQQEAPDLKVQLLGYGQLPQSSAPEDRLSAVT